MISSNNLSVAFISILLLIRVQQSALPLVDNSRPSSPVVLYGTATPAEETLGSEQSYKAHVTIKNASGRGILLMVSEINVRGDGINRDFRDIDDYFFKPNAFLPDASKILETTIGPFKKQTTTTSVVSNVAMAIHVVFVQFVDGTTWGDSQTGMEIIDLTQRTVVLEKLKSLAATYQGRGEREFLPELMKPSQLVDIRLLQSLYNQQKDLKTVINKITVMIRAAESHQRSIARSNTELHGK